MSFMRKYSDPNASPSVFPTYLLPIVPFRRKSRQSSTDSNDSTASTGSTFSSLSSMNPFHRSPTPVPAVPASAPIVPPAESDKFLSGHSSRLHCAKCNTDLCLSSQIISKGFTGRHGRAYLVQGTPSHIYTQAAALPNTYQNKAVPRNLVTGQHTVGDISCAICGIGLGWKYVQASEESQKYKVGKYILETKRIRVGVSWENEDSDVEASYEDVLPLPPDQLRNLFDGPSRGTRGGGGGGGVGASAPFPRNSSRNSSRSSSPGVGLQSRTTEHEIEFDSQDEDECEDLFAGVWSPQLAVKRRQRRSNRMTSKKAAVERLRSRNASEDTLASR